MATCDVAILGGGNGGYAVAIRAAELGLSVRLVEQAKVGGTCLHLGCIPTKALLHSADLVESFKTASQFGVVVNQPTVDWGQVLAYKDSVVGKHYKGLQGLLKSKKIEVIQGKGRLGSPGKIEMMGGESIESPAVVLATGAYPRSLPIVEVDGKVFITSDHALSLDDVPASVIVIGAGAVGLEFASVYASFGAQVTILEALDRLAPSEDEDVSKELTRQFTHRGIQSFTGVKVAAANIAGREASVTFKAPTGPQTITAERCLVAVGRAPASKDLGYEQAGVQLERGFVVVDADCRTGVDGLWAVGDLISQPSLGLPFPHFQLAHVAFAEGIHVAEQIAGMPGVAVDYKGVPRATYSFPEIASVGLTEAQAEQAGYQVEAAKYNWSASGKATILGETGGFVKVVAARQGPVLGVHMIGPRVTELIAEAQLMTNWQALPADVAPLIHPHPTLSEALGETMLKLAGKPLHGG